MKDTIMTVAFLDLFRIGNIKYDDIEQLRNRFDIDHLPKTYTLQKPEIITKFKPDRLSDYQNRIPNTYDITIYFK